jgi:L-lactate dehydrogenase complex protein LldG
MDDIFERFKEKAEAASAEVHRCPSTEGALAALAGILAEAGGPALAAPGPFLETLRKAGLPGLAFEATREAAAGAAVGITQADWALADTGTLVQDMTDPAQRLASSLPEIHVALLSPERILPGMGEVLERVDPRLAAFLAFITGPSRTADIERVLTIGVHGPRRLVILCTEGLPS